jgi:hypothetical protein
MEAHEAEACRVLLGAALVSQRGRIDQLVRSFSMAGRGAGGGKNLSVGTESCGSSR